MVLTHIRNFCILAHIDHGKSTLADRFLEITGTVEKRKMREQYLDMHPLEREKGITIKMQPVRMNWQQPNHTEILNFKSEILNKSQIQNSKPQNDFGFGASDLEFADSGQKFVLNLIDTPGHVDFSYEVSRALAAVEGAILLVDATQGVQAQTLANLQLAQKEGLVVVPAINKIDLDGARIAETEEQLFQLLGILPEDILKISAKTGTGVEKLLEEVIEKVPPPKNTFKYSDTESGAPPTGVGGTSHFDGGAKPRTESQLSHHSSASMSRRLSGALGKQEEPLRALIFDSLFDSYQGVIAYIRIFDGGFKKGDKLYFLATGADCEALEIGIFSPERRPAQELKGGEIGYIATGIKQPEQVRVGDTLVRFQQRNEISPLPGYKEPSPMVFASIFSENQDDYELLRDSLKKLKLNDASLIFEPEDSGALGRGFRAGFLGMLHREIISERLKREYGLNLVFSNPSVALRVKTRNNPQPLIFYSAFKLPEAHEIEFIEEPWVKADIITPTSYLGPLTPFINGRGGMITETSVLSGDRLLILCNLPLREIIQDFYDDLKSISSGFASMAYGLSDWKRADLVRLDILVAGERVAAFSEVVLRKDIQRIAKNRVEKLKDILPRQLFAVAIQAAVENRVIARETLPALKKDVTGYLYGGDRTRKMKLWKKQQKGKKKLKERSRVEIPPEIFLKMMKK